MKNKFDLIIFDWDGTLIDTIPWIVQCLQNAGLQHGFKAPELQATKDVIGLSIQRAIEVLYPDADSAMQQCLVDCYSEMYLSKQLSQADLFSGVYDMLAHLKEIGYQLAVATGKTRFGLQQALAATSTEALFAATRCADETASKPDPLMLTQIINQIGVQPERTLMVGDSIHDLKMAENAKIPAIGVSCGANSIDSLQQFNPLLCLQHPTELLNLI